MKKIKGLIIKPKWADLILDGYKTIEVRGSDTQHRGDTRIIKSKTQKVFGTAKLKDTIKLNREIFENLRTKHLLQITWEELLGIYKNPWGWYFEEPNKYNKPIPYNHKQGCVIWVNIEGEAK